MENSGKGMAVGRCEEEYVGLLEKGIKERGGALRAPEPGRAEGQPWAAGGEYNQENDGLKNLKKWGAGGFNAVHPCFRGGRRRKRGKARPWL